MYSAYTQFSATHSMAAAKSPSAQALLNCLTISVGVGEVNARPDRDDGEDQFNWALAAIVRPEGSQPTPWTELSERKTDRLAHACIVAGAYSRSPI